jgi:hypothetical protein
LVLRPRRKGSRKALAVPAARMVVPAVLGAMQAPAAKAMAAHPAATDL